MEKFQFQYVRSYNENERKLILEFVNSWMKEFAYWAADSVDPKDVDLEPLYGLCGALNTCADFRSLIDEFEMLSR